MRSKVFLALFRALRTVGLWWGYGGAMVGLWWGYGGATVGLWWGYGGATVGLRWGYGGAITCDPDEYGQKAKRQTCSSPQGRPDARVWRSKFALVGPFFTVGLRWGYGGAMVGLRWGYGGATVGLRWGYGGVTFFILRSRRVRAKSEKTNLFLSSRKARCTGLTRKFRTRGAIFSVGLPWGYGGATVGLRWGYGGATVGLR